MGDSARDRDRSDLQRSVTYVIVVHGIGEQRSHETILPVIHQFAASRAELAGAPVRFESFEPSAASTVGR